MTEDIKAFLNRIRDEKKELIHLRLHKEDVRLSLLPGAIQYDKDRVNVSPDDPMLRMIQKLEKVEEKETENEEKLLGDIELANRIIAAMPTPENRTLLRLRYIDGLRPMEWREIADAMNYSEDHTKGKLHGRAIAEARIALQKIEHT